MIEDAPFRARWDTAGWEWQWRHRPTDHIPFAGERAPAYIPAATLRTIQERDGWRCRFCALRLINWKVLKLLCARFPEELPWGRRDAEQHAAVAGSRFSPEHVVPRSSGGSNEPDNLVSACWTCQFSKGDCTVEELWLEDPRDRPPVVDDWDGLTGTIAALRSMV
ncbi:HNH endonuclease [Actinospongicola halichondriae]|uniref:HNH endonuclease n=1 Tax=Actinospongicola halichondriae TaxID=3236844 RepID=UPI003D570D54